MIFPLSGFQAKKYFASLRLASLPLTSLSLACLLLASGCLPPMGPANQRRDRVAYDRSVTKGLQEELLLNIVQLRFGDSLNFLITQQLITNYSYQKAASLALAGSPWDRIKAPDGNGIGVRGQMSFSDNPTAIYQPLSGEQIANLILYPLNPLIVSAFCQGSTPIDMLLALTLESFGSLRNMRNVPDQSAQRKYATQEFDRLLKILRKLQLADAITFRREMAVPERQGHAALPDRALLIFNHPATPEISALQRELREILHLPAQLEEAEVVTKLKIPHPTRAQIPIRTRSMLSILLHIAATIEVPENAVKKGAVLPTFQSSLDNIPEKGRSIIQIHCSHFPPPAAEIFVGVPYEGYFYWISQNDLLSKKAFSLLQIINNLTINRKGKDAQVTIPIAGR